MFFTRLKNLITPGVLAIYVLAVPCATFGDNLPDIGNSADLLMSPEDEKQLGIEFMRQVRQSLELVDDKTSTEYIQALGEKLASQIDTRGQTFTFFIVKDSTINAFAGPAGYIGIHTGLIEAAKTEGELASVIAHEIAHVVQQHLLRSLESSQKMSLATVGAMIAAIVLGSQAGAQVGEAVLASTVAGATQQQLSYSRAHEQEADRVGIEMLARAGYNPNDMADFFEILQKKSRIGQHNIPEFLLTHPVTGSRIADTRGRAAKYHYHPPAMKPTSTTKFELVKARLEVLSENRQEHKERIDNLEQSLSKNEKPNQVTLYKLALHHQELGDYDKARALFSQLRTSDPQRIAYVIASAENEIDSKNYQQALEILDEPVLLYPHNPALITLKAKALLLTNQPKPALNILQDQIRSGRYTPDIYKLLANAEEKSGNDSGAYEALGNYYVALGEINTAIKHFEEALQRVKDNHFRELRLKAMLEKLKREMITNRTSQPDTRNYFDKPVPLVTQ
ncbi:MAG: M48 family metalloprotease [Gammaproteobacteria bacterium]|jgi:predicted Zn-dependent protease